MKTIYRIGLVQSNDVISNNVVLPLAIGSLWQFANSLPSIHDRWKLHHVVWTKEHLEQDALKLKDCDIVAFSCYLWNFSYHYELASKIKQHNPNCFIVFGGPYVTPDNTNFFTQCKDIVDLAIVGEGEHAFVSLLEQWPNLDCQTIPGAWTPTYFSTKAQRPQNLENFPSPYLGGFFDEIVKIEKHKGRIIQAILQTNRGCPYKCSFCEEGEDYKNKIYTRDFQTVIDEIEWFGKNSVEYLTLADDNWGILERDIQLMEKICRTKIEYGFPRILDTTFAKNSPDRVLELVRMDSRYKTNLIRGVTIAIQSTNPTTLSSIKRWNMVTDKQNRFVTELKKLDAPIYAELIWPLPYETYESLLRGFDEAVEQGLDNWIGLYPLSMNYTPLYKDFNHAYQYAEINDTSGNELRSHVKMNNPKSSLWATNEQVVRGHRWYCWFAALYFFGFARLPMEHAKKNKKIEYSDFVNRFLDFVRDVDHGPISTADLLLEQHWFNWLDYKETSNLSVFDNKNVDFWYPYTHLASRLQKDFEKYVEVLLAFLKTLDITTFTAQEIKNSVVVYDQTYPYTHGNSTVQLNHQPPEFVDLHDFCRYYYWWNRKKGYSRTRTLDQ